MKVARLQIDRNQTLYAICRIQFLYLVSGNKSGHIRTGPDNQADIGVVTLVGKPGKQTGDRVIQNFDACKFYFILFIQIVE